MARRAEAKTYKADDPNAWLKINIPSVREQAKKLDRIRKRNAKDNPEPRRIKSVKDRRLKGELLIPERLLNKRLTAMTMISSNYREKLMASVYSQYATTGLQELHELAQAGDLQATKLKLEICGIAPLKAGVSIVNNMYDARSMNVDARGDIAEGRDFETIARKLAEQKERRALPAGGMQIDITAASPTPERETSPNFESE